MARFERTAVFIFIDVSSTALHKLGQGAGCLSSSRISYPYTCGKLLPDRIDSMRETNKRSLAAYLTFCVLRVRSNE